MIPRPLGEHEQQGKRIFQGIPSVACLPSGRLFAVYYANIEKYEGPGNYVILATSNDHGLSWREIQTVSPGAERTQERAYDSEIWLAPDGALWWFWTQCYSEKAWMTFDGRGGVWAARCAAPDCDCPQWEEPRRLTEGVMMNKPLVCADGRWILPCAIWSWDSLQKLVPAEFQDFRRPNVLVSRDEGRTFELLPGPAVPSELANCDEHMVVERKDGSLWMLIRTNRGIAESTSRDGGKTWSEVSVLPYGGLATRFSVSRLKSGNLMLVYHFCMNLMPGDYYRFVGNSDGLRNNLCAWISEDDGKTWQGQLMIDERRLVSYPSVAEGEDGYIYVIYDRDRDGIGQILLSRFTEGDLKRGEFMQAGSFRSITVSTYDEPKKP